MKNIISNIYLSLFILFSSCAVSIKKIPIDGEIKVIKNGMFLNGTINHKNQKIFWFDVSKFNSRYHESLPLGSHFTVGEIKVGTKIKFDSYYIKNDYYIGPTCFYLGDISYGENNYDYEFMMTKYKSALVQITIFK